MSAFPPLVAQTPGSGVADDARPPPSRGDMGFLTGGGGLGGLIRAKDWSATPIGPPGIWPQSLRTAVSLCLASNFPINIIWGPGHTQIYNDGYRGCCGDAHPRALGEDYSVTWASAWPVIGESFERALAGETVFLENQRMFLPRLNGALKEAFFTFSHSPIRDESGGIGGLFHPVTETTATMLSERRTRALRDLSAGLGAAVGAEDVARMTVEILSNFGFDLPFLLYYALDEAAGTYRLAAHHGAPPGGPVSPLRLDPGAADPWPLADATRAKRVVEAGGLRAALRGEPCGPYEEPPDRAFVLPIDVPSAERLPALLVAGVSPRLPLTDAYRSFYDLLGVTVAGALATVRAREDERRRAEALAEIDRAKTLFFSNVSHEFRTPLTLMLGPIEDALAEAGGLPAEQRGRLEVAHRGALRLLKLVNSLLDFSRIEAGRAQASFEPVDLAELTAGLASNFRSACERAGLDLAVDCPPLRAPVHVDRDMWEKVVLNLISNAFKFTLEGGIAVALRDAGAEAELAVRDTGVGIPAGDLPRVFERFHRVEGQRGRTHEGSGIGLALVDELVRLHGGRIGVSSAPGRGTEFRVAVPFGTAHLPPDRVRGARGPASTAVRASAYVEEALRWVPDQAAQRPEESGQGGADVAAPVEGRPRVVLADDNADMRAYVAQILERGGYEVEAVGDGGAALAAARRGAPPDLVLTDVMMPGVDGFALLRGLRADPATKGLPVVLLSARAGEEARVEGLAAGADDYLVKPFSARELRARVDGAVGLARQRREAAARERDLRAEIATQRGRAALRESERRLAFALEAGRLGSWELDLAAQRLVASDTCRENLGLDAAEPLETYDDLLRRIHPDDLERQRAAVARAVEARSILDIEYRVMRRDGRSGWVQVRGRAEYAEDGRALRMLGVSLDVTDRKRAEERKALLLDELNHRVKNTLATVQSIAMQTQRNAKTPAAFGEDLTARIAALSRAHDLLTQASWDGASLGEVVGQTLDLYATGACGDRRVTAEGPVISLNPNAAVTLNMAFHELATNAAKYGALSIQGGRVEVRWRIDRGDAGPAALEIVWSETGGPPVQRPGRRGFGSRLIERGLPGELGGEASLEYPPEGVRCRMRLPVSAKIALTA
ncbi:hypothetical protein GCM10009416_43580 [Craurococcus roseus]|uniref:histidine kinase n=1 Tax=Craurococcus roseus TaxID=77585 RepID=A0ABN1FZ76_9PROT